MANLQIVIEATGIFLSSYTAFVIRFYVNNYILVLKLLEYSKIISQF